jgi:hypothetical protein
MDIEIVEGSPTYAAALNNINAFERLVFQEPEACIRSPERLPYLTRRSWEFVFVPSLSALENANRSPRLRQSACRNGPSKTRTHDHNIIGSSHPEFFLQLSFLAG